MTLRDEVAAIIKDRHDSTTGYSDETAAIILQHVADTYRRAARQDWAERIETAKVAREAGRTLRAPKTRS